VYLFSFSDIHVVHCFDRFDNIGYEIAAMLILHIITELYVCSNILLTCQLCRSHEKFMLKLANFHFMLVEI
jgi:hypothetical protein